MQIPIASSLYYTIVVIRRPELWGPVFYSPYFKYKQCFHEKIINNDTNHKDYDATMCQSYSTYFTSIGNKYTPCQGVVWSKYRLSGTFYVPINFGVVLFAKVCFFIPMQFWKAVHFTLALLWLYQLDLIFKLQYLMTYSFDFNIFCRFQLLAVCTTLL